MSTHESSIPVAALKVLEGIEPGCTFEEEGGCVRSSSGQSYIVKSRAIDDGGEQLHGEAESLKVLWKAAPGLVPQLFACINDGGTTHFISQFLHVSTPISPNASIDLAERLATEVHQFVSPNGKFGFGFPTYCGRTRLEHGWHSTWDACFASLVRELLAALRSKGPNYREICDRGERVCVEVIPKLLGNLDIRPVLLHGDLWSGNAGSHNRRAAMYDPASYFGHNEADLAIGRMFEELPTEFFEHYHTITPRTEPAGEYEARQNLYQMFHYLNHTVIFGWSYHKTAMEKINDALDNFA